LQVYVSTAAAAASYPTTKTQNAVSVIFNSLYKFNENRNKNIM